MGSAAACAALWALGCQDLSRFDTEDGEAYCGSIIDGPFARTPADEGGFERGLRLKLEVDTDTMTTRPAVLTSDDAADGPCEPRATFNRGLIQPIPEVFHDALSHVSLGDAQEYTFIGWVESSCRGTMLAIVSLMSSEKVQVRLLRPPPAPVVGEERAAFALFELERRNRGCGY